jgi:hypothetical protein
MMKKLGLCLLAGLVCLSWSVPAFCWAMVQPYGKGRIYPVWRSGEMPKDILSLMNFPGRAYGESGFFTEIGQWENLYFQGSAQVFNRFLDQYSHLKMKPLVLTIHVGQPAVAGLFGAKPDKEIRYDWQYSRFIPDKSKQPETVNVDVWLGGNIRLDEIKVPANIEVKSGGEIEKFIADHEARRKAK